jgi:capsular exopolysaccharide synthesis family protein
VLARIPIERGRSVRVPLLDRVRQARDRDSGRPLAPGELSAAASEAYRTLRGTLEVSDGTDGAGGRSILIAGSSPSDGKTTTAVNLAASLAQAGHRVILIEADQRRPAVGAAFGVRPWHGVAKVILERMPLKDALVTSTPFGEHLGLLLTDTKGETSTELFALPSAKRMLDQARQLAEYVIIDSPPLTDVVDALPLAKLADQVLLIARLGNTRVAKLAQLGELLAESGIRPVGMVLVGTPRPSRREDHYYHQAERQLVRDTIAPATGRRRARARARRR